MARIKWAYIGGGSTRAAGTMASFVQQGENFDGSEVVLIDLNEEHLRIVQTITQKLARAKGLDLTVTITTNRRKGLHGCDAVLTSYRPGGFEARYLDESIPLKYGVIGQETQGPGGFFMALRTIHVMKGIIEDMEAVCPSARLFNYTNPINIVSEAVTHHTSIPTISFCEGPIMDHLRYAEVAGLKLACRMNALPNHYFQYYYFKDEILAELQAKPTTRAQEIMEMVPDYWTHYREQAAKDVPELNPDQSRGGIHELELAIDVMDAIYNDRKEVWYVNVPNQGAISDFPDDLVVELVGYVDCNGVVPLVQGHMPRQVVGLVKMLGEYQALAAEAAWSGKRNDAIRALASHPLVFSLYKAEAIYDEMAAAHKQYLPERLLQ